MNYENFILLGSKLTDLTEKQLIEQFPRLRKKLFSNKNFHLKDSIQQTLEDLYNKKQIIAKTTLSSSTIKVKTLDGIYISKFIRSDSHEAAINKKLAKINNRYIPSLEPELSSENILTWRFIDGKIDEATLYEQTYEYLEELFSKIIRTLVSLQHEISCNEIAFQEIVSSDFFINLDLDSYENLPGFNSWYFVRAYQSIENELIKLKKLKKNVFVHGDFKLDNILINDSNADLMIIDWEKSGVGACETDLGNFIGCLISNWITYKAKHYSGDFSTILSHGKWSPADFFTLLRTLFQIFQQSHNARGIDPNNLNIWKFSGLFLMHRAWVSNTHEGRLNLASKMCIDMGTKMVKYPERFQSQIEEIGYGYN